jgi:glycosyltransferase involved in cell wall biosynthesis
VQSFHAMDLPRADYVLSVGALTPLKGFDFIIEGLARVPQNIRPRLILVGFMQLPAERAYLEAFAERQQVQLDIMMGVTQDRLIELYNQALMTIYTPVREPFGLVPLESMACGTPVVSVSEGGVKETVIDGITGRLVARNADELAAAVTELVGCPSLIRDMGQAGRAYVQRDWTWEQAIVNLERHLVEVAERRAEYQSERSGVEYENWH